MGVAPGGERGMLVTNIYNHSMNLKLHVVLWKIRKLKNETTYRFLTGVRQSLSTIWLGNLNNTEVSCWKRPRNQVVALRACLVNSFDCYLLLLYIYMLG